MQQGPSCVRKYSSASQGILHKFWNPKVHCHFHLSLYGSKSIHSKPTSIFLKIHFNIYSPTYASIFKVTCFLYDFPLKSIGTFPYPYCYITYPCHFFLQVALRLLNDNNPKVLQRKSCKQPYFPIFITRPCILPSFLQLLWQYLLKRTLIEAHLPMCQKIISTLFSNTVGLHVRVKVSYPTMEF